MQTRKPLSNASVQGWAAKIKKARFRSGSGNPVFHSKLAKASKKLAVRLEFARLLKAYSDYLKSTKGVSNQAQEVLRASEEEQLQMLKRFIEKQIKKLACLAQN